MAGERSIVINGDLGSGKSTVTTALAERLDIRRVAMGDVHRQMAQSLQMTTLELNQHAEMDEAIDDHVDQVQKDLAGSGEQLVVDSRLGWHFFPDAFKVNLIIDSSVAAQRVVSRPSSDVESYTSAADAQERLERRASSERVRFIERYGVDKYRLRNYDLVVDTTRATPGEIVSLIVDAFSGALAPSVLRDAPPLLLLDPRRIFRTADPAGAPPPRTPEETSGSPAAVRDLSPVGVVHLERQFCEFDGSRELNTALGQGFALVACRLVAEADESLTVAGSAPQSAEEYFSEKVGSLGRSTPIPRLSNPEAL